MCEVGREQVMARRGVDFPALFRAAAATDEYWVELAKAEFTEAVACRLRDEGVSQARLAKALGVSPAYVSKLLRGDNNFTIETMVRVARTLGARVEFRLVPPEREARRGRGRVRAG